MATSSFPIASTSSELRAPLRRDDARESQARELRFAPALECVIDGGSLAIPVDAVAQLVEYEVAPLPLSRAGVSGIARVEGRLVVSLSTDRAGESTGTRRTKGVLLRFGAGADSTGAFLACELVGAEEVGGDPTAWCIEVREVLSFIDAAALGTSQTNDQPWFVRGTTKDGRELACFDARELVRVMSEGGRS